MIDLKWLPDRGSNSMIQIGDWTVEYFDHKPAIDKESWSSLQLAVGDSLHYQQQFQCAVRYKGMRVYPRNFRDTGGEAITGGTRLIIEIPIEISVDELESDVIRVAAENLVKLQNE